MSTEKTNTAAAIITRAEAAQALAEAATPGPWEAEYSAYDNYYEIPEFCHVNGWTDKGDGDVLNLAQADAYFIAASRAIVPDLARQVVVLTRAGSQLSELAAAACQWLETKGVSDIDEELADAVDAWNAALAEANGGGDE